MKAFYNIYFSRCQDVFQLSQIGKKVSFFPCSLEGIFPTLIFESQMEIIQLKISECVSAGFGSIFPLLELNF